MAVPLPAVLPPSESRVEPQWKAQVEALLVAARRRTPSDWNLQDASALFVDWMYGRGCQELTVKSRYILVRCFLQWCRDAAGNLDVKIPDRDLLRRFFGELKAHGRRGNTIDRYRSSLQLFFAYLVKLGVRDDNPMDLLHIRPQVKPLPITVLRDDELQALLQTADLVYQAVPDRRTAGKLQAFRDKVLLELLLATGLRGVEVAALKVGDVDLERARLAVRGKGGGIYVKRRRTAFIDHPVLLADLKAYIQQQGGSTEFPLFPSQYRTHLTSLGVRKILKRLARKAGLTRRVYAHLFRHTYCCHLINHGADAYSVQKLMGHTQIEVTLQYYLHLTPAEVRADWQAHSPLAEEVPPC
ncbi:MAG TPA: tyrosine-type recombinase/integrase [Symbiobacteriaceae bacterium]|nr:tyrosine-type recombinase/integrase [Symbiobacteriaceae bacterium]